MGAWIETFELVDSFSGIESHPTWVRGLKLEITDVDGNEISRILRGCVD